VSTGPTIDRANSRQDYETDPAFIRAVSARFGALDWDLAASDANAQAPDYFTEAQDSLTQDWVSLRGVLWLNPPYATIGPWAAKCADTQSQWALAGGGGTILLLVPAAVGANWYRDHVHDRACVLALNGRLTFVGETHGYPRDLILCVYRAGPHASRHFDVWSWNEDVRVSHEQEVAP
jgi:phage N-6-adenine-methyltransferase